MSLERLVLHSSKPTTYESALIAGFILAFGSQIHSSYLTYFRFIFLTKINYSRRKVLTSIKSGTFSLQDHFLPGNLSAAGKTLQDSFIRYSKNQSYICSAIHLQISNWLEMTEDLENYTAILWEWLQWGKKITIETISSEIRKPRKFGDQAVEVVMEYIVTLFS